MADDNVFIDLNDPTVFKKYCERVEKFVKNLKNSKYSKELLRSLEVQLEPIYKKWLSESKTLPGGPYSKYRPSQLKQALSKSKLKSKVLNRGISDFISYFYIPKVGEPPEIPRRRRDGTTYNEKLLMPRSYYTMLDSGITPHSLGKGNMTKKSALQRITTNTKTSNYHNKGYYLRMIDKYGERIHGAELRLKKYQEQQAQGHTTTQRRKGRGFVTSNLSDLIQNARQSIERNRAKVNEYKQRFDNVDKWSQHGTQNVIRSKSNRFWKGKRFANKGVEFMINARKEAHGEKTKIALRKSISRWARMTIYNLQVKK